MNKILSAFGFGNSEPKTKTKKQRRTKIWLMAITKNHHCFGGIEVSKDELDSEVEKMWKKYKSAKFLNARMLNGHTKVFTNPNLK